MATLSPTSLPGAFAPGAFVLEALSALPGHPVGGSRRAQEPDCRSGPHDALGREQQLVLASVFEALSVAGRYDLARFLLSAFATLLRKIPDARAWVGSLQLADGEWPGGWKFTGLLSCC